MTAYNDMDGLHLPPHSIEAEQSVLGSLLLDNGAWERLDGQLAEGDFYRADHRRIFACIAAMLDRAHPADVITVFEALNSSGKAEEVGGLTYLNALAQNTPSAANIRRYAEIVRGCRIRRDVMAIGQRIADLAAAPAARGGDTAALVEEVTGMVMATLADTRHAGREPQTIGDLLPGVIDAIEERADRADQGVEISGLSTGFREIDRLTCGLQAGDLIIVAGRPSMGKSTFAVNIAENAATAGSAAFVVSLEMSAPQPAERSVARFGAINTQSLRSGRMSQDEYTGLTAALARLNGQQLVVADDPALSSVARIRLAARKVRQRLGTLDLIVIDYLQLMRGDGATKNEEIGSITRALKLLARELACPIVLLSQLNRGVEQRPNKRPVMSDLRDSGAIEQDADLILFIYRDEVYHENSPLTGFAEVLVRKNRMGPLGDVPLTFQGEYSRFLDADLRDFATAKAKGDVPVRAGRGGFE